MDSEEPNVRFVPPVKNKDQSRVPSAPLPEGRFDIQSPILKGAYATLNDKAFK